MDFQICLVEETSATQLAFMIRVIVMYNFFVLLQVSFEAICLGAIFTIEGFCLCFCHGESARARCFSGFVE